MRPLRTLRPVHAAVMLLTAFIAAQVLGGILAIVGLAVAVGTGGIDRSALETQDGIFAVMANPFVLLPSTVGSSLALVAVAAGAPLVLRVPLREALAIQCASVAAWIVGPIGALGCSIVADEAVFYFGRAFPEITLGALGAFSEAARADSPLGGLLVWIAMALLPGTCEELFFRGAFQGALSSGWSAPSAILVTSVAFGAIHLDPPQALGAAILAVYLGWLTHRTRSVGPAIVSHIVNNSAAFVAVNLPAVPPMGYGTDTPVPWGVVGAAGVVVILAVATIAGVTRRREGSRDSPMIP